ncbi:AMP-binding protein [Maricaulis sp.]|uniref:AMP-binding protein n=1 Tax=Maricaulis sp. TaxID=1486257 RepID=UPI002611B9A7|nr:AMP-binding protein [Maricaulis sp.]
MTMIESGHTDSFTRDHLPPAEHWPVFRFDLPELNYPDRLNAGAELLDAAVRKGFGDKPAIITPTRQISYRALLDQANRIANYLTGVMGVVPGNRVLLHGFNSIELSAAWFAVIKCGAVAVTTMPMLRAAELSKITRKAEVEFALCDSRLKGVVEEAASETGKLNRISAWGEGGDLENALPGLSRSFTNADTARDDIALLACTSGTTGEPKACAHFHSAILAMADTFARYTLEPEQDEIYTGTPPLAFTFGLGAFLVFPARFGLTVALPERPGFEALCETIEACKATTVFTAPTGYRAMMVLWGDYDLTSLRKAVSAGEHLPEATSNAFHERTGLRLIDGIGATEMIHIFISAAGAAIRPGATGQAVPGYRACLIDTAGKPVSQGEIGRLALQGPTGCLYLDDERQGVYVQDGWNLTGDLYRCDEDGYYWYVSRADDLIVSSGYNIAGPEVEEALLSHDAVSEAAVIGVPDAERGAIVKAFIVLAEGRKATTDLVTALQTHVKSMIAPYKYPRDIEFIDALPKTQTGKIQRFKLRRETISLQD